MSDRKKYRDPEELENARLVQQAEEEHEVKFNWYTDVDPRAEFDSAEEDRNVAGREWFYCVATAPDGRRASLSKIEDPDPVYKLQVEADLARELGIEPDFLPPPEEEMHLATGYDESVELKPLTYEEWERLKSGDIVVFKPTPKPRAYTGREHRWKILEPHYYQGSKYKKLATGFRMQSLKSGSTARFNFKTQVPGAWYVEKPPEEEEMHLATGYDEARKPPPETIDVTETFQNYETASAFAAKLKTLNYFDAVNAAYSFINAYKYFRPRDRDNWKEEGFVNARVTFTIEYRPRAAAEPVLQIATKVYGFYNEEERARRGFPFGDQLRKKNFPARAMPRRWPGPGLLKSTLDPAVREKLNGLFGEAYATLVNAFIEVPEIETMHTMTGYDEARRSPPSETIDLSGQIPDAETARSFEKKLKDLYYFNNVLTSWGHLSANKYFDPPTHDLWEEGYYEARIDLIIGSYNRRLNAQVLSVETLVSNGLYSEKAKAQRKAKTGGGPTYGNQKAKKDFPLTAVPLTTPGPALLAPSLDPTVRAKLSDRVTEAYALFVKAFIPALPEEETMHTITGYDESLRKNPITYAEWETLGPGDIIIFKKTGKPTEHRWTILKRDTKQKLVRFLVVSDKGTKTLFHFKTTVPGAWYLEGPPEPEEMHTITGYDETLLRRVTRALVDANPLNYDNLGEAQRGTELPELTVADFNVKHPVLAKYPWAKDIPVRIDRGLGPMGRFIAGDPPEESEIVLADHSYTSTLKHELTHLLQHIEGREAGGSSTTMWMGTRRAATLAKARELYKDMMTPRDYKSYKAAAGPWDSEEQAKSSYKEYRAGFKTKEFKDRTWREAQVGAGQQLYHALASEKEAEIAANESTIADVLRADTAALR